MHTHLVAGMAVEQVMACGGDAHLEPVLESKVDGQLHLSDIKRKRHEGGAPAMQRLVAHGDLAERWEICAACEARAIAFGVRLHVQWLQVGASAQEGLILLGFRDVDAEKYRDWVCQRLSGRAVPVKRALQHGIHRLIQVAELFGGGPAILTTGTEIGGGCRRSHHEER